MPSSLFTLVSFTLSPSPWWNHSPFPYSNSETERVTVGELITMTEIIRCLVNCPGVDLDIVDYNGKHVEVIARSVFVVFDIILK